MYKDLDRKETNREKVNEVEMSPNRNPFSDTNSIFDSSNYLESASFLNRKHLNCEKICPERSKEIQELLKSDWIEE
jgi:hypothetical protein